FFFFQAEDGIRDLTVTGVQTCALPISVKELGDKFLDEETGYTRPRLKDIKKYRKEARSKLDVRVYPKIGNRVVADLKPVDIERRSEERRVGKSVEKEGGCDIDSKTEGE